ncbi:MAG: ACT domain-containing protein [Xanthomonadales bacterium]|nr:ACT domain-containing protein [Xanthomonadales bacterium]
MNIKLRITLKDCEGALLRLLGTIERRGHRLVSFNSRQGGANAAVRDLALDVDCGSRSPDVLVRQLRRLYDVLSAAWYECPQFESEGARLSYETTLPAMYGLVVHRKESAEDAKAADTAKGSAAHG